MSVSQVFRTFLYCWALDWVLWLVRSIRFVVGVAAFNEGDRFPAIA